MVKKYRKKPVVIEAIIWNKENQDKVWAFINNAVPIEINIKGNLVIATLEVNHEARVGDYIIRGVAGEFYPVKNDIFLLTYEQVD